MQTCHQDIEESQCHIPRINVLLLRHQSLFLNDGQDF